MGMEPATLQRGELRLLFAPLVVEFADSPIAFVVMV